MNFSYAPGWSGNYGQICNLTAFNTKIATLLCPSDGNAGQGGTAAGYTNINNYFASIGTTTANCCQNADANTTGLFAYETNYSIQQCIDGTSNTIAFGEGLTGEGSGSTRPLFAATRPAISERTRRPISRTSGPWGAMPSPT